MNYNESVDFSFAGLKFGYWTMLPPDGLLMPQLLLQSTFTLTYKDHHDPDQMHSQVSFLGIWVQQVEHYGWDHKEDKTAHLKREQTLNQPYSISNPISCGFVAVTLTFTHFVLVWYWGRAINKTWMGWTEQHWILSLLCTWIGVTLCLSHCRCVISVGVVSGWNHGTLSIETAAISVVNNVSNRIPLVLMTELRMIHSD